MRRKHSIPAHVGGQEILDAYKADKVDTVRREETSEEIAQQRKILEQAKWIEPKPEEISRRFFDNHQDAAAFAQRMGDKGYHAKIKRDGSR